MILSVKLPNFTCFDIILIMNDTDKPIVEVKLSPDNSTASVVVTFPFAEQAFEFREVINTLLNHMPQITTTPDLC